MAPFGPLKPSPVEYRGTQLDDGRIQGSERMLEPESPSLQSRHRLTPGET